jgi:hypothetical protein
MVKASLLLLLLQIWIWYLYDFLRSPQGVPVLPNVATGSSKLGCKIHKPQSYGY